MPCGGEGFLPLKRGDVSSGEGQKEGPGRAGCGVFSQSQRRQPQRLTERITGRDGSCASPGHHGVQDGSELGNSTRPPHLARALLPGSSQVGGVG